MTRLLLFCVAGICFGDTAPKQVHLALAGADAHGHPTGMNVAWFTAHAPTGPSTVAFGLTPDALTSNATSSSAAVEYLKGEGFHHNVRVVGLAPGTQYHYKVGSAADGFSKHFTFKTAPSAAMAADPAAEYNVAVFGDMGYLDSTARPMVIATAGLVKEWSATVSRVRLEALKDAGAYDWAWHLGDIGYTDDAFAHHPVGFFYESVYNDYMNWLQNLTAGFPYMVSVGNHESECHSPACVLKKERGLALSNFTAYNQRWHMPAQYSAARAGQSMWCSWNYGPVHFVSINSETDWKGAEERDTGDSHDKKLPAGHFGEDGEYLKWLEADLKAAAAARAAKDAAGGAAGMVGPSFIVAGGHRPYGDIASHEKLFAKYGVDLYLAGHGHSYTRSVPVNGTTYIMAGGAGCDEMHYLESDLAKEVGVGADWARLASDPTYVAKQRQVEAPGYAVPEGSEAFKTGRISVGTLKVNTTALSFQLLDSVSGEVLDATVITKADQLQRRLAVATAF